MQTQDDDFPYTSDDPSLAPIEETAGILAPTSQTVDDLKATLRLVVGSGLAGRDAYVQRLRQVSSAQETVRPETITIDENETFRDQLRYLLLGILFETPDIIQRGLVTAEYGLSKIYGLFSKIVSPFTNSRAFSPLKDQVDHAAARGEKVIDRLIMKGRIEEQNSRLALQQETINDMINEVVEYMVQKTEIRQIIQEEGVSVAGDVIDEYREQSAAVDTLIEQKLKSVFRRSASSQPGIPTNDNTEGG